MDVLKSIVYNKDNVELRIGEMENPFSRVVVLSKDLALEVREALDQFLKDEINDKQ